MALPIERHIATIHPVPSSGGEYLLHFPTGGHDVDPLSELLVQPDYSEDEYVHHSEMYSSSRQEVNEEPQNNNAVELTPHRQRRSPGRYVVDQHTPWTLGINTTGNVSEAAAKYFEEFGRYLSGVERYLQRLSRSEEDALDIAQMTHIKTWNYYAANQDKVTSWSDERKRRWYFLIAKRTFLDERRRKNSGVKEILDADLKPTVQDQEGKTTVHEWNDVLKIESDISLEDQSIQNELKEEIIKLLNFLPKEQRDALILSDLDGCNYLEIAEILQVPIGTIKSRINRARSKFRKLYTEKNESTS